MTSAAFTTESDAWDYCDLHPGIMGRQPISGTWRNEQYGDWRVEPLEVYESKEECICVEKHKARQAALSKLSAKEIEALRDLGV